MGHRGFAIRHQNIPVPAGAKLGKTGRDGIVNRGRQKVLARSVTVDHIIAFARVDGIRAFTAFGIVVTVFQVQDVFGKLFNAGTEFERDGSQFDRLFNDQDEFAIGTLPAYVLHTPGHTPACLTYVIGDCAFVGDTLFMPDFGTARADFPGGDARQLYRSIKKVLALPAQTKLFMCHDYKAPGRDEYAWQTTVAEERANNVHVRDGISEDEFVAMREARDAQLGMPRLIVPSIQVNMRAGNMPEPEDNGIVYLKTPVNRL